MKNRVLLCILLFCLLLSFSACAAPDSESQSSPSDTNNTVNIGESFADINTPATDYAPQELPLLAVSLPVITQSETAEDGTVLFNYTFQNLSLVLPDPEVADKVILDFLNRIDLTASEAETIRTAAIDDYKSTESWNPYLCQITYDPTRIDTGILSMFGSHVSYSGAVHAGAIYRSVSYDLVTGNALALDDIFTENAESSELSQLVLEALNAKKEQAQLFDGFEITVAERFEKNYQQDKDWFFSNQGLCFFFSPYEIGPYASGTIIAEIPYSKLVGLIDDAYFPAEKESIAGNVFAKPFDNMEMDEFSQFAEVILKEDGTKILLYTDKAVYDVRIETGSRSSDDGIFTPEHTVFSAYGLSAGNAIMLQADFSLVQPAIRLSYTTGDETVYQYLTLNDDGATLLTVQ